MLSHVVSLLSHTETKRSYHLLNGYYVDSKPSVIKRSWLTCQRAEDLVHSSIRKERHNHETAHEISNNQTTTSLSSVIEIRHSIHSTCTKHIHSTLDRPTWRLVPNSHLTTIDKHSLYQGRRGQLSYIDLGSQYVGNPIVPSLYSIATTQIPFTIKMHYKMYGGVTSFRGIPIFVVPLFLRSLWKFSMEFRA